jgi:hypothetical protein
MVVISFSVRKEVVSMAVAAKDFEHTTGGAPEAEST